MTGDEALLLALSALNGALSGLDRPFMLIGGLAVIARGVPRDTDDIDATVWAPSLEIDELLVALQRREIVGRIADVAGFARANQVLLLRHEPTGTPLEISLAWLPFEEEAIARAEILALGSTALPVALAEDLVIYKAVAWRDRDRADIERLLVVHRAAIHVDHVREVVRQFAEALEEPERLGEFDALVARALADEPR